MPKKTDDYAGFLEKYCPTLSRECDAVSRPVAQISPVRYEMDIWEAYEIGYQEADRKASKLIQGSAIVALAFGLACGLMGWVLGRL